MNKKAKFFCESCGAEVPHNSRVCVNCGKFFASVRCPNCGKTGSSSTFINGCPDCGYAVGDSKNNYNFNNINKSKNKLDLIKLTSFCTANETINKMKR